MDIKSQEEIGRPRAGFRNGGGRVGFRNGEISNRFQERVKKLFREKDG